MASHSEQKHWFYYVIGCRECVIKIQEDVIKVRIHIILVCEVVIC